MNDRIEEVLDCCVDRLVRGENVADAVEGDADLATLLQPLLETSTLVAHQLRCIQPSPEFKQAARTRTRGLFFAKLARRESNPGFLFMWWQRRWATAMATVMVACLASLGVLAASVNALPSGFFYPVKTTTEQMRLSLTVSDVDRAQLQLEYTERRLTEMTRMAGRGDTETVLMLAAEATRLIAQMCAGALFGVDGAEADMGLLLTSPAASAAVAPAVVLGADRDSALDLLQRALQVAPEELRPDIEYLVSELSREFDATISHLELATTAP